MELRHRFRRLVGRWALIVAALGAAGAAAAYAISDSLTPIYEADGSLLVVAAPQQQAQSSAFNATASQVTGTYAVLITANPVLQQVIKDLGLSATTHQLASKLEVTPERDTEIITIAVRDPSPELAAAIANTLMTDFIAGISKQHQAQIVQAGAAITNQMSEVRADLAKAEQSLANIKPSDNATALNDRIKADHDVLTQLTTSYSTFSATQAQNLDNVVPVSSAPVPTTPVFPRVMLSTAIGGVVGALLGIGLVVLLEYLDQGLRSEEDVRRRLGMTTLGVIPTFAPSPSRSRSSRRRNEQAAEAYRRLRTNLRFCAVDRPIKSVVITSSQQGEGKTSTSANLACIIAASGQQVLLVDADMRRPAQHSLFGKRLEQGMSELLLDAAHQAQPSANGAPPPPILSPAALNGEHRTGIRNLSLLTAGTIPPNPAELLASKHAPEVIRYLELQNDLVVIDTPPVDVVTDALGLAATVGATVLVVRAGGSVRQAQRAVRALQNVGANVVGVVLNKARDDKAAGYYYYGGYYGGGPPPEGSGTDDVASWTPITQPLRRREQARTEAPVS